MGSILAITNSSGALVEQRQFGAWGSTNQFLDQASNTEFSHNSLIGRGFTGHEHFFEVGLIHMNGRMYDAQLGRFLSPDNYIQEPYSTQSFNRYGYVWNNPLVLIDPSGEIAWVPILVGMAYGALIGAGTSAAIYTTTTLATGQGYWLLVQLTFRKHHMVISGEVVRFTEEGIFYGLEALEYQLVETW